LPYLIVKRDDRVEREIELAARVLRIGRDSDNDLVLEDDNRGVSRFHAEIRPEGGRYTIADLESRNGTWVDGERVTAAGLSPGSVVTLGPFSLEFRTDPSTAAARDVPESEYTIFDPGVAQQRRDPVPPQQEISTPYRPAIRNVHDPRRRQAFLFAGTAVIVAVLIAITLLRTPRSASIPPVSPSSAADLAPTEDPRSSRAEISQHISAARRLLDAGQLEAARRELEAVSEIDPTNADARSIREQLDAIGQTNGPGAIPHSPAASRPLPDVQRDRPRAANNVERKPGESEADWRTRTGRIQDHYAAANTAIGANDALSAIQHLKAIEQEQPGYLDVAARLTAANELARMQAQQAVEEGGRAEQAEAWQTALQAYRRAQQLDSTLRIDDRISRTRERSIAQGTEVYRRARQYDAYDRPAEAVKLYEQAVVLLPADDLQRQEAIKRLQILKSKS
jgi:pSer/pThr/pTyr-binding forkhead associated (FHA) protein/tetratricopeptide (TPR) repeat protein